MLIAYQDKTVHEEGVEYVFVVSSFAELVNERFVVLS